MTLSDLINRVWQRMDENDAYFPQDVIIVNGINPAMRLITYARPHLLVRRVVFTTNANFSILNLRAIAPRYWRMLRVVAGDATGDLATPSGTDAFPLTPATLKQVRWRRDWYVQTGTPRHYWLWGEHYLGLWPRPNRQLTFTLIFSAIPLAFTSNDVFVNPSPEPELPSIWHPLIGDTAAALLLIREGIGEVEKAQAILQNLLTSEQTVGLRRIVRQAQTAAPVTGAPTA